MPFKVWVKYRRENKYLHRVELQVYSFNLSSKRLRTDCSALTSKVAYCKQVLHKAQNLAFTSANRGKLFHIWFVSVLHLRWLHTQASSRKRSLNCIWFYVKAVSINWGELHLSPFQNKQNCYSTPGLSSLKWLKSSQRKPLQNQACIPLPRKSGIRSAAKHLCEQNFSSRVKYFLQELLISAQ